MDTESAPPPRTRSRGKSHSRIRSHAAIRRDYVVGILLLLVVVVLWTSSNFVTQVSNSMVCYVQEANLCRRTCSRMAMRSRSCESTKRYLGSQPCLYHVQRDLSQYQCLCAVPVAIYIAQILCAEISEGRQRWVGCQAMTFRSVLIISKQPT